MADIPGDFFADLRSPGCWPALAGSLWRSPRLVEATYGQVHRLVRRFAPAEGARVLDAGCGTGFLSLELARAGHRVLGVDADAEAVEVSRRLLDRYPELRPRLRFERADLAEWEPEPASFDLAVAGRVLHHLPAPGDALERIARALGTQGRLVCVEFAHDRFEESSALWLQQARGLLEAAGLWAGGARLPDRPAAAVRQIAGDWRREHEEEDLRTFEELEAALGARFVKEHFAWLPYLYWDLLVDLEAEPAVEEAVAEFLRASEAHLVETGRIPATLFLFVGRARPPAANPGARAQRARPGG